MNTTRSADGIIRRHNLSGGMLAAIRSGANGAVLDCTTITEKALIRRGIMHPTRSTLTALGKEILTALNAAEPAGTKTPAPAIAEGVVISHDGTTRGSQPKYSEDPDVRAAVRDLGTLKLAELTDHHDFDVVTNVRGGMVEPRGDGRIAVYWLEGGRLRDRGGNPFEVQLSILHDKLSYAGWRIEPGTSTCVMAWRTAAVRPAPAREPVRAGTSGPAREVYAEEITYALHTRADSGEEWQHLYTPHTARTEEQAREVIDDIAATSEPGRQYRVMEVRRTLTAMPHQPAVTTDPEPGPVPARRLRSGYRVRISRSGGEVRLVWRVEFHHQVHVLLVHLVPLGDEGADYSVFGLGVNDMVELLATGPAVDATGRPAA